MNVPVELKKRQDELTRRQTENALLRRKMDEHTQKMRDCAERLALAREATAFLEDLANARRGGAKAKIEQVVAEALKLVYGPEYGIEMEYSVKNNRSCLDIFVTRETPEGKVRRQIDGIGGGVSDTVSVPLRLMVLLGSKQTDRVCVLDECYKHMDSERIEAVAEFLRAVSERLKVQTIMATHHDAVEAIADKTFVLSEKNGRSSVK